MQLRVTLVEASDGLSKDCARTAAVRDAAVTPIATKVYSFLHFTMRVPVENCLAVMR